MELTPTFLLTKSSSVEDVRELEQYVEPMFTLMRAHRGIGLAANQVGLNHDFFIMDVSRVDTQRFVIINPIIVFKSDAVSWLTEGCLSYPDKLVRKKRYRVIRVEYTNLQGIRKVRRFNNKQAIVVQHEMDHLDGKDFLISD